MNSNYTKDTKDTNANYKVYTFKFKVGHFIYPCLDSNQDPLGRGFKPRMSTNFITRAYGLSVIYTFYLYF